MFGTPHVFGADYFTELLAARMGLNYSRDNNQYLYSSDRMAQYMGNGLLTFIDRATGFGELFSEQEVVFYDTTSELAEKIRHYATHDHERQTVARQGWEKIHREWNSEKVAQYILDTTGGTPLQEQYHWPASKA
jgi:spore maturation protein CgeB